MLVLLQMQAWMRVFVLGEMHHMWPWACISPRYTCIHVYHHPCCLSTRSLDTSACLVSLMAALVDTYGCSCLCPAWHWSGHCFVEDGHRVLCWDQYKVMCASARLEALVSVRKQRLFGAAVWPLFLVGRHKGACPCLSCVTDAPF